MTLIWIDWCDVNVIYMSCKYICVWVLVCTCVCGGMCAYMWICIWEENNWIGKVCQRVDLKVSNQGEDERRKERLSQLRGNDSDKIYTISTKTRKKIKWIIWYFQIHEAIRGVSFLTFLPRCISWHNKRHFTVIDLNNLSIELQHILRR